MADILIEENGKLTLLKSVNTVDYCDIPEDKKVYREDGITWGTILGKEELENYKKANVLINPDLSKVEDIESKYWKIEDGKVVIMTNAEKKVVEDAEVIESQSTMDNFENVNIPKVITLLVQKGILTKEEIYG